jgi:epoxyqueuosine reductase
MPISWEIAQALLAEQGHRARIVSLSRSDELREEIESHRRAGRLDEELYQAYLADLSFQPPDDFPEARSIIVTATRDPLVRFHFKWKGNTLAGLVPPTYLHGLRIIEEIESLLGQYFQGSGHRIARAQLPRKLLAARSGLARYGRNNIAYVQGMGSFHRLSTFFTSLSCDRDGWQPPEMLERCETCSACHGTCPSGAIGEDRFLLHAERCIVFHNEKPAHVPFPDWIRPSWHNCLVGCMICQQVCPENQEVLDFVREGTTFSEEETRLLVDGVGLETLPAETAEKLGAADLAGLLDVLPRNLRALLVENG